MNEQPEHIYYVSERNFVVTLLLCIFLGYLGIHRFYAGKVGTGILMLITCGLGGIWVIIDLILIILGVFKDKEGLPIKF
ncbi:MAG TPA: TM2 domain-containing protein [Victivallales bacterium]|nr:TM2 domain-containing protein [Victivallales bacterium]